MAWQKRHVADFVARGGGAEYRITAYEHFRVDAGRGTPGSDRAGYYDYLLSDGRRAVRTGPGRYVVNPGAENVRLTSDNPAQPEPF